MCSEDGDDGGRDAGMTLCAHMRGCIVRAWGVDIITGVLIPGRMPVVVVIVVLAGRLFSFSFCDCIEIGMMLYWAVMLRLRARLSLLVRSWLRLT